MKTAELWRSPVISSKMRWLREVAQLPLTVGVALSCLLLSSLPAMGAPTDLNLAVQGGNSLTVTFGEWLVYLPAEGGAGKLSLGSGTQPLRLQPVTGYVLVHAGAVLLPGNNTLLWSGGPETLLFRSSDPQVATISPQGQLQFLSPGTVQITVASQVSEVNWLYRVIALPFGPGDSQAQVVAALGSPDEVESVQVAPGQQVYRYGHLFQATGGKSIRKELWSWEGYPGLVVVYDPSSAKVESVINWGQELLADQWRQATQAPKSPAAGK
ncbi:MAG: hypothetical protein IMX01_00420 [Limnochordaceae bacterium]|nr:hypothetical protein [Limnochordaceae bacterium]